MLKVGINGIGRIGKAIFKNNLKKDAFKVVALNDINPDRENLAYQINYDTLYGRLDKKFRVDGKDLVNEDNKISIFNNPYIDEVPWDEVDVDLVIDSSGVLDNVLRGKKAVEKGLVRKVVVTHSPEEVDFTMVLVK